MVQQAWKNHPMHSTGILYKTPSKYGPTAIFQASLLVAPTRRSRRRRRRATAPPPRAAKKKGEPTSDPTWPDVKRWFHVDRDAKVCGSTKTSTWKKGGPTSTSASAMNVLKKGEIHLTKYTVIKLYTEALGARERARAGGASDSASRCSRVGHFDPEAPARRSWQEGRDRGRDTAPARAAEGRGRVDGVVLAAQVLAIPRGRRQAHGHDDKTASAAPTKAASNGAAGDAKKKELPTKAGWARVLSSGNLGTSPSEKRGGGDEKVTAAELRFLLTTSATS